MTAKITNEILLKMSETDRVKALELLSVLEKRKTQEEAQKSFIKFVKQMWSDFIPGPHHKRMADAFERVKRGELKRLIINLAPRHSKSELTSFLLPAWWLGHFPKDQIMQISHTAELAEGFGRKVRNLLMSDEYTGVFNTRLSKDSTAAARWNTSAGGKYVAMGVGGAVAGLGANLLIIDDPVSEQEGKSNNPTPHNHVYDYFMTGPRQRLQPGGAIIVVQCMVGDTDVLMADGSEKHLRDIKVGDEVVTYIDNSFATAKINNHQSNGVDKVYTVQTQSGIIVRANKRHPFLVDNNGELEWKRLEQLLVGDILVSLKGVTDQQGRKQKVDIALHAKHATHTTEETLMHPTMKLDIMGNGSELNAVSKAAQTTYRAKGYAKPITTKENGNQELTKLPPSNGTKKELRVDMASLWMTIREWLHTKKVNALSAYNLQEKMSERIGEVSYVSTIVTTLIKLEPYYVTIATLLLGMARSQKYYSEPQNTYEPSREVIQSINYDGEAEVFDIEVDQTENFIANGLVSHNTRWSKVDLTGRLIDNMVKNPDGDQWEVIEFPAILPSGKPLWEAFWSIEDLLRTKAAIDSRYWNAQYMQNPTSEEGAIVKREWWRIWDKPNPPPTEFILMSWDTAYEKHNRADYSAMTVWGVFYYEDEETGATQPNIMLLDAVKKRVEFPELKQWVYDAYNEWQPDSMIVEKRASGASLIQELRRMGIPTQEFTPGKGNDKISRLTAVADIFASGFVWCPNTRWAQELMDEVASFPASTNDDLTDTVSMSMMLFRQGGHIRTRLDEPEEEITHRRFKREYY